MIAGLMLARATGLYNTSFVSLNIKPTISISINQYQSWIYIAHKCKASNALVH